MECTDVTRAHSLQAWPAALSAASQPATPHQQVRAGREHKEGKHHDTRFGGTPAGAGTEGLACCSRGGVGSNCSSIGAVAQEAAGKQGSTGSECGSAGILAEALRDAAGEQGSTSKECSRTGVLVGRCSQPDPPSTPSTFQQAAAGAATQLLQLAAANQTLEEQVAGLQLRLAAAEEEQQWQAGEQVRWLGGVLRAQQATLCVCVHAHICVRVCVRACVCVCGV